MTLSLVEFRQQMAEPLNRVSYSGERIILQRHGKGVAAVVSLEDLALLEALEEQTDIKAARRALKEKSEVPLEKIKAELGIGARRSK